MKHLFALAAAALLAGCAADPSKLSTEQLQALARDKATTVACVAVAGLTGRATTLLINIDQTRTGGMVTVQPDCSAAVTYTERARP